MFDIRANNRSQGIALIMILLVVAAVTVVSLGFIVRGDVSLACGKNTELKAKMDYLAESGLEHARGLILNPQDIDANEYWHGAIAQQLDTSSSDYYDVNVMKLGECNYRIISTAYRKNGGQKIAQSSLTAQLRLDPCIGLRTGDGWTTETITTVYGDVYSKGYLKGTGHIGGDAYAHNEITVADVLGSKTENVPDAKPPVVSPPIQIDALKTTYRIGETTYSVTTIGDELDGGALLGPTAGNPAGVYFCNGNLEIDDDVTIYGTLVVDGDLEITGTNNKIIAQKNFPAIVCNNKLRMYNNAQLLVHGLVQIKNEVEGEIAIGADLTIVGALFIKDHSIAGMGSLLNSITVTAAPDKAAIKLWADSSSYSKWTPAAGAFFKSIERTQ